MSLTAEQRQDMIRVVHDRFDVDADYKGYDGLERNRKQYKWEYNALVKPHMAIQPKSHDPFTNFFVESSRIAPWWAGHMWRNTAIAGVLLSVLTGTIGYFIGKAVACTF